MNVVKEIKLINNKITNLSPSYYMLLSQLVATIILLSKGMKV